MWKQIIALENQLFFEMHEREVAIGGSLGWGVDRKWHDPQVRAIRGKLGTLHRLRCMLYDLADFAPLA